MVLTCHITDDDMPRNLDMTSLRSFVAIADAGGVTRAAGFLNLTQSAVSMQIKRLEEAIGAPLPQVKFCPTGGVSPSNAPIYLGLSNTLCVGGSWVAPADKVASGDWAGITELARTAAALSR